MAEVVEFAKPEAEFPAKDGFVMTDSARNMLRSLKMGRSLGNAFTLIAAAPGTGKTEALKYFAACENAEKITPDGRYKFDEVFLHTAVAGEGTPWGLASQFMHIWRMGQPNSRKLTEMRQDIGRVVGAGNMLLVDEAQYLVQRNSRGKDTWDLLEWLRAMADEVQFSVAYCGDLALLEMQHQLPQLWRRVLQNRPVIIRNVSKGDIDAFLASRNVTDAKIADLLFRVSRRGGGLGTVAGSIVHARLLAGGKAPDSAHIMAALEDLNLLSREDRQ